MGLQGIEIGSNEQFFLRHGGDAAFGAERSDLHTAEKMLGLLERSFHRIFYEDHGYSWEGYSDSRLAFTAGCR